ncbi:MAG: transglutaminase domain-containing protein, partial [Alkalispirochaeta sp.]
APDPDWKRSYATDRTEDAFPEKSELPAKLKPPAETERTHPRDARAVSFTAETAIDDPILLEVYRGADTNGDDRLSWNELEAFQRWVKRRFRYEHNSTALPPDQFGAVGGGDCEDFALYTCGLLAYWGYECYVGVFVPAGQPYSQNAHAVALMVVDDPAWYPVTIDIGDWPHATAPASSRTKTVIPIDYDVVGGFTEATPDPWVLSTVYVATSIYGTRL